MAENRISARNPASESPVDRQPASSFCLAWVNSSSLNTPALCNCDSCCNCEVRSDPAAGAAGGGAAGAGAGGRRRLLSLGVSHTLLIGLILSLLPSRLLPCVLLLLMMVDSARRPGNYGGGGRGTHHWTSSSHHTTLLMVLIGSDIGSA